MRASNQDAVIEKFLKLPADRIDFEIGRYYMRKKSTLLAYFSFTKMIESSPGNPLGYIYRASARFSSSDYSSACEDLTQAMALDPKLTKLKYYRGWCYERLGEYGKAIDDYSEVIKLYASENDQWDAVFKNPAPSYYCSGVCGFKSQDYLKAISFYISHSGLYLNRGLAYAHLGSTNLAIADLRKAVELDPKDINAYAWLMQLESASEEASNWVI